MIQLKVLDLSHHNDGPRGGPIDFQALAAFGIKGIIHKASQGTGFRDRMYQIRRRDATAAGLLWGAYHFADNQSAHGQVQHFLATAEPDPNTLMALDYEPYGRKTMSLVQAKAFLEELDATLGRRAVLYSGNLIKEQLRPGNPYETFFAAHRLWLAHYNDNARWPHAWPGYWLHQFSGDGHNNHGIVLPGVNPRQASKLDMNSYLGTDDQLLAEWAA